MLAAGTLLATAALATTSVGVNEDEYHVALFRTTVAPGTVRLNVTNIGMDPHDLAVRSNRTGKSLGRLKANVAPAGGRAVLKVRLTQPGSYRVYCTLKGHAALGMTATLRVKGR